MRILFFDDLSYSMRYFVQALRDAGIRVEVRSTPDRAIEAFQEFYRTEGEWDGAVLDLMFDEAPEYYKHRDPSGNRTGLLLLEDLRQIQTNLKVIFLTNRPVTPEAQEVASLPLVKVVRKLDSNPILFTATVRQYFGGDA